MKSMLVIGLALLLGACNTTPSELEDLDEVLRAYEHSIRWSRLELAGEYYKDPPEFSERQLERLKNIKVTDYKVMNLDASISKAMQRVEIRYFNTNNAVVRELTDIQIWEYDKESERWSLISSFPDFK